MSVTAKRVGSDIFTWRTLPTGAGYMLAVRAEARGADWPLETEVVQQHPAALVDEQGAPILVNG